MKILIFGRGAIATLYGWAFTRAGHQVEYFVRPGRAAEYGSVLQVDILDCRYKRRGERVSENLQTSLREDLPKNHDFDLILLASSITISTVSLNISHPGSVMPPCWYLTTSGMNLSRPPRHFLYLNLPGVFLARVAAFQGRECVVSC